MIYISLLFESVTEYITAISDESICSLKWQLFYFENRTVSGKAALWKGSRRPFVGNDDVISQVMPRDNEVFLTKVMSRKKHIFSSVSTLWGLKSFCAYSRKVSLFLF